MFRNLTRIGETNTFTQTSTRLSARLYTISRRNMSTSRSVIKSVYAQETPEGSGVTVRRSIGTPALRNLSPFLMLDHATIKPNSGFPQHPHRGQTTVTYVLDGMMQHEDSQGNEGILEKGDVQWMTAGRGIVHSEMPLFDPDPAKRVDSVGLQLWVDLPAKDKFIEPSYQEKKAKDIDTAYPSEGVSVTVISGESHGTKGFVRSVGGCWYLDFRMSKPGSTVFQPLPKGWTSLVYVIEGELQIGESADKHVKYHTLVLSSKDGEDGVTFTKPENSEGETRFVLIAGEPLDQEVVQYGPFVVNTKRQAMEAIQDFREGKNGFENSVGWESKIGKQLRG